MTKLPVLLVTGVLAAGIPLSAQDARRRVPPSDQTAPSTETSAPPAQAVPRTADADRSASAPVPAERAERVRVPPPPAAAAPVSASTNDAADPQRRRGDNPSTGGAVPRTGPAPGERPADGRGGRGVSAGPGRAYNNFYYYPRRYYPYGYGAFGLGYFYYNPYAWAPYGYYGYGPGYYPGAIYGGYGGYGYDIGSLRIDVKGPKHAEVLVDGYYAGTVDDFDGTFQALQLESGPYKIEVRAPGFEPLQFDIRVLPGRKITYRGELRKLP